MIVDVRGVKLRCADGGKEVAKNAGTAVGELVEDQRGARQFGEDGQETSASRRLQHDVSGRDCGGDAGDERQPDRCRELLEDRFPRTDGSGSGRGS